MTEPLSSSVEPALWFDRFQVLPRRRLLLEAGKPVRLGSRAFDILLALTERPGERIGKNELLARIWPDTHVVEGNLKVQMVALRRVLRDGQNGKRFIDTSPGQGYCFVATVSVTEEKEQPAPPASAEQHHNLPEQLTLLIGRDAVVTKLLDQLTRHRLLTIVGPGGIGKTSVALAVAHRMVDAYEDGVWAIDFSRISDPALVLGAVAGAVGLKVSPGLTMQNLVGALRGRRMMLVLDNCAHIIDAAATLVSAILRGAPDVRILATSREPLRTEGEHLCRLEPLETPPPSGPIGAAEALRYSSVQFFVEQAAASLDGFQLADDDAPRVAEICRKLDGIPLAIELAAARVGVLGLGGLAEQLDNRLRLLTDGRRTALPRHRTMRAALGWSYDLLTSSERTIFNRLAVFVGGFTLAAASSVAADESHLGDEVVELVLELATKSLVVADVASASPRFRLLDTTRAYALEKLAEVEELEIIARRHAEYHRDLFERADAELETGAIAGWLEDYGWQLDNIRSALDWAFSRGGDPSIGVALTAAAVPLWIQISLVDEARRRVEQAFDAAAADAELDARREMKLSAALGASLIYTRNGGPEVAEAWTKVLKIAESLGDADYQMLALWGLWAFHVNGIQYHTALRLARRFSSLALTRCNPNDRLAGERMTAISYHFLGNQRCARRHIERALPVSATFEGKRQILRFELDPRVTARVHLARILWMQGFPDRAMLVAEQSIADARTSQHAIAFNYALHRGMCPIALWIGDLSAAARYGSMQFEHAKRHGLQRWEFYGRGYQGAVAVKSRDIATGLRVLKACFEELGSTTVTAPRFMRFATIYMAEAMGQAGHVSDALLVIDDAIERAERTGELWDLPELMRIRGELLLLQSACRDPGAAEKCFRQALGLARPQAALSWELRAAASLAQLLRDQERSDDAVAVLQPVFDRFTEGFDTADLKQAKALLDPVRSACFSRLPLV